MHVKVGRPKAVVHSTTIRTKRITAYLLVPSLYRVSGVRLTICSIVIDVGTEFEKSCKMFTNEALKQMLCCYDRKTYALRNPS